MNEVQISSRDEGGYLVTGELTLATVGEVLRQNILPLPHGQEEMVLDLSKVSHVDSGGLALLIAWARQARASGCLLKFCGVSGKMASLARVTGVDRVLSFQ